jgi:hypothetical protein
MIGKANIETCEGDVLELIYKIVNNDEIVNLKEGNFSHYKLENEEKIEENNEESLKSNLAYKNFKDSLKKLQLSSMIKKVNTPTINHSISIYCHENDLLIQSITLNIVLLLKPLLNLSINIVNDTTLYQKEKIHIIKNYLEESLDQLKDQVIKKFFSLKKIKRNEDIINKNLKSSNFKKILNDKRFLEIKENLDFFNESLIQHLLLWLQLSLKNSNETDEFDFLDCNQLYKKISNTIDDFFEKNMNEIFNRIQF